MPSAAQTLGAQLAEKQTALSKFFDSHKSKKEGQSYDMTSEEVEQVKGWNDELNDLGTKWQEARELEDIEAKNRDLGTDLARVERPRVGGLERHAELARMAEKSLGDVIVGALYDEKGQCRKGPEIEIRDFGAPELKHRRDLEVKTTMTTAAGLAPVTIRSNKMVLSAQRPVVFMDILPTVPLTTGSVYEYMQETTFTNSAAATAENTDYPESALAYTPVDANVRKIGTYIPVTEEQLSDVDGMRALIDNRLTAMVLLAADTEVLTADGTGSHINGFLNQVTQGYALSSEPPFDAIFRGMNKVRNTGFANPDAVVMHPDNFLYVRLARTDDGIYIMGNPDVMGSEMLFGIKTVQTTAMTTGTALVGDFGTYSALITRWGMDVQATNSHASLFIRDVWTIKARIRIGLAIYRLTAFCKVTSLP
jgi:HK97 family phage major capsid protein